MTCVRGEGSPEAALHISPHLSPSRPALSCAGVERFWVLETKDPGWTGLDSPGTDTPLWINLLIFSIVNISGGLWGGLSETMEVNGLAQRPPGTQPALGVSISFIHAFIEQVLVEYYVFQVPF